MTADFYRNALHEAGFDVVTPNEEEMDELDRIITEELIFENFRSRAGVGTVIDPINSYIKEGVEGVILGCRELPLILKPG